MIRTGLDRLLERPELLAGRRYALLAHAASVTADLVPAHLALARIEPPRKLLAPEHGYYGVEQDMVASADGVDPWTGVPIVSLYGAAAESLRPAPERFADLDLLVVDVQDVGARYYTFLASAVWAAEAALASGCRVLVLDRPNPLGGEVVEGNLPRPGLDSFVGAFRIPVRHGLTAGELVRLEAARCGWDTTGLEVLAMVGWRREMLWPATGRPWIAPSPNMPGFRTALVYPGVCLLEATAISEGRGTTRPFELVGAPGLSPTELAGRLEAAELAGVRFLPVYFRPQFQKHAGAVCGGVELVVTDARRFRPVRCGVVLLAAVKALAGEGFAWRQAPYEFESERHALDLLAGDGELRRRLEAGEAVEPWIESWREDEAAFLEERAGALLYPPEAAA